MRHRLRLRKMQVTSSHRQAKLRNLSHALIENDMIKTTLVKAKELRKYIEPLVTLAKKDDLHSRRLSFNTLRSKKSVKRLFETISKRAKDRKGGYTRILKNGYRAGDNSPMAIIEFVDRDIDSNTTDAVDISGMEKTNKNISEKNIKNKKV